MEFTFDCISDTSSAKTDFVFNTQYAPLAVLLGTYHREQLFSPLENVSGQAKEIEFSTADKLEQILVSILARCDTISEVNNRLSHDAPLVQANGWSRFADQSTLARCLNSLSRTNIEQMRQCNNDILHRIGVTTHHDWRRFLWLDYDLSGLRCSARAEASKKGYFGGKKTSLVAN